MKNLNQTDSIYIRKLKTTRVKLSKDYVVNPLSNDVKKVLNSDEAYEVLKELYAQLDDDQEHLVMLVLNPENHIVGFKTISAGIQHFGSPDAKIIFRNALLLGATKIVLTHNHPSGLLTPSGGDIRFTRRMITAGSAIDIPVADHIIFTHNGYVSMRMEEYCTFSLFA